MFLQVESPLSGELKVINSQQGDLNKRTPLVKINVPCEKGDYLTGYIESANGSITIEVIGPSGKVSRRLIDRQKGKNHFYSIAENCEEIWQLSGSGNYLIVLEERIGLRNQVPTKFIEPLSPSISALLKKLEQGENANNFWLTVEKSGTPIIEKTPAGTVMTFLVRGDYSNVKLLGAPSNNHESLQKLANSDTWYKSFIVPVDTQLSYQIAPEIPQLPLSGFAQRIAIKAVAQVDPYNNNPWPEIAADKYAQQSTISLPEAPTRSWIEPIDGRDKGTLSTFSFTSNTLANIRDITIYSPPVNATNKEKTVLLYIFDARAYIELVDVPTILDNLIAEGKIPPVIAVFISNPDGNARARELPANKLFADVIANELVPQINQKLEMIIPKERTVIGGSSYGGLAATTIALRHPEIFGNVISMSGSFWWYPKEMGVNSQHFVASEVINMAKKPVRFFLSAGLFETSRGVGDGILETNRHLRDVLSAKGYKTFHTEYSSGHDYFAWQGILGDGLLTLFPLTNNNIR
ncbi:enterochelin esterase and related enzymes [Paraglaciecola arctica BSs20135]|uniref:Enterochelin esterase and related enzymes n=2 Tax=Paraglaciecola TaxID=1621534 RepID=K6Y1T5_9ALTE|nr:enterochelin esterase and related enzymes [Paraglaciecola arctica BSs20135]